MGMVGGMKHRRILLGIGLALAAAAPAGARSTIDTADMNGGGELSPYLQCVPYARQLTGIQIYGDAHTWWGQAEGRYRRGSRPKPGAVMAFRPHGNSRLGHVAAVRKVLDSRTILIDHANWSSPGEIERNVRAVDVSPGNDWSEVRVWYGPSQRLGANHWPLAGFIYNEKPGSKPSSRRGERRRKAHSDDLIADIIAGRYR